MLLRHRAPAIDPHPSRPANAKHVAARLRDEELALVRWLRDNKIEYLLVGPVAEALRGGEPVTAAGSSRGPVAIVPAPYSRNLERLARALFASHARLRVDTPEGTVPTKLTSDKLAAGGRWHLRCGAHDLDLEPRPTGTHGYQEMLYEAHRIELEPGLAVEVASPEHLEHYAQLRRTGRVPEIRIVRGG